MREWLKSVTWEQLQEWHEYDQVDPLDERRNDLRFGSVVAAIYNVNLRRGATPLTASDCALEFKPPPPPLTAEQQKKFARHAFDSFKAMMIATAQ